MLVSTVGFSGMVMLVRMASADLHAFEIAFFRNLFGLLVLLPWFVRFGLRPFKTERIGLHVVRNLVQVATVLSFFLALTITPLALATALSFIAPIFATILAVVFFREVVGVRRWAAILFSFVGTYIILRPGLIPVTLGPLLVIVSSLFFSISLTIMKVLSRTDSTVTITCYSASLLAAFSLIPAAFFWQWPTWEQLAWLVEGGFDGFAEAVCQPYLPSVPPGRYFRITWWATSRVSTLSVGWSGAASARPDCDVVTNVLYPGDVTGGDCRHERRHAGILLSADLGCAGRLPCLRRSS